MTFYFTDAFAIMYVPLGYVSLVKELSYVHLVDCNIERARMHYDIHLYNNIHTESMWFILGKEVCALKRS